MNCITIQAVALELIVNSSIRSYISEDAGASKYDGTGHGYWYGLMMSGDGVGKGYYCNALDGHEAAQVREMQEFAGPGFFGSDGDYYQPERTVKL